MTKAEIIDYLYEIHAHADYSIEDIADDLAVPVRHGRWVPKFNGNFKGGAYWYECSECGHTVPGGLQSGKIFCENCGSDMRKDGEQQ